LTSAVLRPGFVSANSRPAQPIKAVPGRNGVRYDIVLADHRGHSRAGPDGTGSGGIQRVRRFEQKVPLRAGRPGDEHVPSGAGQGQPGRGRRTGRGKSRELIANFRRPEDTVPDGKLVDPARSRTAPSAVEIRVVADHEEVAVSRLHAGQEIQGAAV